MHGKVFYFLITAAGIQTITNRNVHDRLVLTTGAAYADWSARRAPGADVLSVTVDQTPVLLAPDGTFDATLPDPGAPARLTVTTAAGEATTVLVP